MTKDEISAVKNDLLGAIGAAASEFNVGPDDEASTRKLVADLESLCDQAARAEAGPSKEAQEEMKAFIYAERDKGNIVVLGLEGPMTMPLEEFVKQPADGILYDLNRLEEVAMTFLPGDRKWVNDYAVALTIRKLVAQRDDMNKDQA